MVSVARFYVIAAQLSGSSHEIQQLPTKGMRNIQEHDGDPQYLQRVVFLFIYF